MQLQHSSKDNKAELSESRVNPIPKEWTIMAIKELADVKGGKRLPLGGKFADKKTPHPYIRVLDFKDNTVDSKNLKYISEEIQRKINRYTISHNDLYISIAGTIGLAGLIPRALDGANLTENALNYAI